MDKKEARQLIRQRKKQYSADQLIEKSKPVTEKILAIDRVQQAKTVLLYYSMSDEVDTHGLVSQLYKQGKRVILPVVIENNQLELRPFMGTENMKKNLFGILEPATKAIVDEEKIDLAFIPGMAFDKKGNRLGRGKGYYDRLLSRLKDTYKIGVCFDFQVLPSIPTEQTDIPMDEVICE